MRNIMLGFILTIAVLLFSMHLAHASGKAMIECPDRTVDVLVLGDSQTGGSWATSYFGNFIQSCLKTHPSAPSFAVYGRGGTQPVDWLNRKSLDSVDVVYRDLTENHKVLRGPQTPQCMKRLNPLLAGHKPKKIVLFFGDNLLSAETPEIQRQYRLLLQGIRAAGIAPGDCLLVTPTYEMEVSTKRNVPAKNITNTRKVLAAIRAEVGEECRILDGLELMKSSPLLKHETLRRVAVEGTNGCFQAAANDNIHLCGEAARELANRVCAEIRN
ncbi:MAG: hypothetical protein KGP28_12840 [Bdellovibrionales bacterium]|nr:hypothetical protein [Bdellovibrionales bacterium]